MTRGRFRHLPVCGGSGLAGIIDITDIRRALTGLDVSRRPTADADLRQDGLTPATNEPPSGPGTSPAVQPPPGDDDRNPPGSFYVAGDGARDITGQFMTDAGCDLVSLGGLDKARAVEDLAWVLVAAMKDGVPVCCRFAVPGEL